jgi:hypothetical protein
VQAFAQTSERASHLLRAHRVRADAAALIVWLYALEIAVRYLEDREQAAGPTRLGTLSAWLADVLQSASARTRAGAPP